MEIGKEISDKKIIVGLMLLQLAVTLPFINSHAIGLDEPFSIFYAQQDLKEFIPFLNKGNNPPLHFIVLHFWIKLFGIGSFSVRSLSVVFSVLTIPVLFQFGKQILNRKYVILLVGFFIFSTFNHFHAIEARVYSLMTLLVVLIFYEIYNLLFTDKKVFFKLAILNVLLLYSHYLGGLIIGVELILMLMFYRQLTKEKILYFLLSGFITIVLYIPGILLFFERIQDFSDNGTWVQKPEWTELYGNVIRFFNHTISFVILISLLISVGVVNRKVILPKLNWTIFSKKEWFVFLMFLLPYVLMYLFSIFFQPLFLDRYLLFTTPFLFFSFIICVKFVLTGIPKENFYVFLFSVPMVISCYYIPQTNRNANELSDFVKDNTTSQNIVAICPPFYDLTFMYHYDTQMFSDYKNIEHNREKKRIQSIYSFEDIKFNTDDNMIFLVDANSQFLFPNNNILPKLNENCELIQSKTFDGGYTVYQYAIHD